MQRAANLASRILVGGVDIVAYQLRAEIYNHSAQRWLVCDEAPQCEIIASNRKAGTLLSGRSSDGSKVRPAG